MVDSASSAEERVKNTCEQWKSKSSYDFSIAEGPHNDEHYVFDTVWSKPTPEAPIPEYIVRVKFTVKKESAEVKYLIEHHGLEHTADIEFREAWFDNVIKLKSHHT